MPVAKGEAGSAGANDVDITPLIGPGPAPTDAALGAELGMTASEAHAAVERAMAAKPAAFPPAMPLHPSTSRSGRAATLHRCGPDAAGAGR